MKGQAFIKTGYLIAMCLFFLLIAKETPAQGSIQISAMTNYDLLGAYGPGFDLTMLIQESWGLRYTLMADMVFLDITEANAGAVSQIEYKGDLKLPMILKTIDYRSFGKTGSSVFDFLTAYMGLGYNNLELSMTRKVYQADTNTMVKSTSYETVNSPTTAAAFGLYGGERFLVVDARLMLVKGKTDTSDLIDDQYEYEAWMLLISFGIGF
jgi:hypothetical protein